MPYKTNADLPESVKNVLPEHAQKIYLEAFNNAWEQYDEGEALRGNNSREETAQRVAWAAVKRTYQKDDKSGTWKEK